MNSKKRIAFAAIAATGLVAPLGLTMGAAHADWEGTITGKVVNADGSPARYVDVHAVGVDDGNAATYDGNAYGYTDRNGVYRISVSRSNTYTISIDDYPYSAGDPQAVSPENATGTQGAVTGGPTFTLPAAAQGAPVAPPTTYSAVLTVAGADPKKEDAYLFNTATGDREYGQAGDYEYDATTDTTTFHPYANGRFYFFGVAAGTYKVEASGPNGYVYSGNKSNLRDAAAVAVGTGTDLGGLTVPNDRAPGTVTGHITLPRIAGFDEWSSEVTFYTPEGAELYGSDTDAAGNFSVDLAPGTYLASASGTAVQDTNFGAYAAGTDREDGGTTDVNPLASYNTATAWYGAKTRVDAKKIVVSPNGTVTGVNISLSNSLKPLEKPVIKGNFKKGKKLSVTHGVWNKTNDVAFTYAWKAGNKTIGTKAKLKLSKKVWKKQLKNGKRAKKLTVVVTAADKGQTQYADASSEGMFAGSVKLKVAKTIKAQVKAAQKQLKKDTKKDKKAIKKAAKVG